MTELPGIKINKAMTVAACQRLQVLEGGDHPVDLVMGIIRYDQYLFCCAQRRFLGF